MQAIRGQNIVDYAIELTGCSNTDMLHQCFLTQIFQHFSHSIYVSHSSLCETRLKPIAACDELGNIELFSQAPSAFSQEKRVQDLTYHYLSNPSQQNEATYMRRRCRAGFYIHLLIIEPVDDASFQSLDQLFEIYSNQLGLLWHGMLDALTGLMNRRAYEERLLALTAAHQKSVSRRREKDVNSTQLGCLAMIDIDYFKNINDAHGHVYGDEVLVSVATMMQGFFRDSDMVFRVGGEEFVVMLNEVDIEMADKILDRFRAALSQLEIPRIGTITVSIGYSQFNIDDHHSEVAERADKALYFSKNNGRNKVSCYEVLESRLANIPVLTDISTYSELALEESS